MQSDTDRITLSYRAFFGCNFLFIQGKEGSCYHRLESDISRLHVPELQLQGTISVF